MEYNPVFDLFSIRGPIRRKNSLRAIRRSEGTSACVHDCYVRSGERGSYPEGSFQGFEDETPATLPKRSGRYCGPYSSVARLGVLGHGQEEGGVDRFEADPV